MLMKCGNNSLLLIIYTEMFRRGLKSIDFYKNVPAEYKEGTIAGACISIISISCLVILTLSSISTYMSPNIINDLIID